MDCLAKYIKVDLKHKPGAFKQIYRKTTEKKDCFEFIYDAASEFYVLKIMQLSLQKFEGENYRNRYSEHFDDFSINEFVSVPLKKRFGGNDTLNSEGFQEWTLDEFKTNSKTGGIFNMKDHFQIHFVNTYLLDNQPSKVSHRDYSNQSDNSYHFNFIKSLQYVPKTDYPGYLYVYCMDDHLKLKKSQKLSHIILFKIGQTKSIPKRRVNIQSNSNKEQYTICRTWYTKYIKYFEWVVHKYFRHNRVLRPDLKDGKTEWFLVTYNEIVDGVDKI